MNTVWHIHIIINTPKRHVMNDMHLYKLVLSGVEQHTRVHVSQRRGPLGVFSEWCVSQVGMHTYSNCRCIAISVSGFVCVDLLKVVLGVLMTGSP